MALELKLKYEITSDRSKLIITDQTGEYSATNTGGWGAPNTLRNAKGLYAYVTFQPFNTALEEVTSITPVFDIDPTYTNSYASVFEFSFTKDGWYRIALIAMTQIEYDAVVEPESLINSELFSNIYLEDIILVNTIIQKNCYLEKYINCIQCTSCKCEQAKEDAVKIDLLIQSIDYRFHSGKQFEAQRMLEILTKQYKCCN